MIALANEKITEELAKVQVVGLVVKTKGAGVIEEDSKFVGIAPAEEIGTGWHRRLLSSWYSISRMDRQ
jgi:hypothetical protein